MPLASLTVFPLILKTTLPLFMTLLLSVIVAVSVIVSPVVAVMSLVVSVGVDLATLVVIVSVALVYLFDPEYAAVMVMSCPPRFSGTVYSAVAIPSTTLAYTTLPFASFTVLPVG